VPKGALAVTGNLTVVTPSSTGWAFVGPSILNPATLNSSTVNSPAGDTRADGVTVKLAGDGSLSVVWVGTPSSKADLVFDVTGYYVGDLTGSRFVPIEPTRLVDTRYNLPFTGPVPRGTPTVLAIAGHATVPLKATGISGNLTVTQQTYAGYLTVAPTLDPGVAPAFSTVNFPKGDNRANGFVVRLNTDGSLAVCTRRLTPARRRNSSSTSPATSCPVRRLASPTKHPHIAGPTSRGRERTKGARARRAEAKAAG